MRICHRPTGEGAIADELAHLYHCLYECREHRCEVDDRWIAAVERRLEERFGPEAVRETWRAQLARAGVA